MNNNLITYNFYWNVSDLYGPPCAEIKVLVLALKISLIIYSSFISSKYYHSRSLLFHLSVFINRILLIEYLIFVNFAD